VTTYTVTWNRVVDGPQLQHCNGLTDRDVVRRLIGAIENGGPITIHSVRREQSAQETPAEPVAGVMPDSDLERQIQSARAAIAAWPDDVKRAMGVELETCPSCKGERFVRFGNQRVECLKCNDPDSTANR
jgi:hypothetical protein